MKNVAETTHLTKRGDRWHYYRRVPTSLVPIVGKTFIKKSLGTSDLKEARVLRNALNVQVDAEFAALGGSLSNTYAPSLAVNVNGSGNPKHDRALADMIADQVDAKLKANSGQGNFRMSSGNALAATQAKLSRAAKRRG